MKGLWKNASRITVLLIIAAQIISNETKNGFETSRQKRNAFTRPIIYQVSKYQIQATEDFLQGILNIVLNTSRAEPLNNLTSFCVVPLCSINEKAERLLDLTKLFIKNNSNVHDMYNAMIKKHRKELNDIKKSVNDKITYCKKRIEQAEQSLRYCSSIIERHNNSNEH